MKKFSLSVININDSKFSLVLKTEGFICAKDNKVYNINSLKTEIKRLLGEKEKYEVSECVIAILKDKFNYCIQGERQVIISPTLKLKSLLEKI